MTPDLIVKLRRELTEAVELKLELGDGASWRLLAQKALDGSGDEQVDLPVLVGGADGDVAQPAEVAERDLAERVDLVAADAVVLGSQLEDLFVEVWRQEKFELQHPGLGR